MTTVPSTSTKVKSYLALWDALVLRKGILYRKFENEKGTGHHLQLIVPDSRKQEIFQEIHSSPAAGHFGLKENLRETKTTILLEWK